MKLHEMRRACSLWLRKFAKTKSSHPERSAELSKYLISRAIAKRERKNTHRLYTAVCGGWNHA